MVPLGTVETKFFAANQQGLGTNSNLLRNARWNLDLSWEAVRTLYVQGALPYIQNHIKNALYSKLYQKRPIVKVVSKMPFIQSYQKRLLFKFVSKMLHIQSCIKNGLYSVKEAYILSKTLGYPLSFSNKNSTLKVLYGYRWYPKE